MRRTGLSGLAMAGCAVALLATSGQARALEIFTSDSFTISGNVGLIGLQQFDPALGTLNHVVVEINGQLGFTAQLPPGTVIVPPTVQFGASGTAFAFSGASFLFNPLINLTQQPQVGTEVADYTLSFTLSALTDLTGIVPVDANASGQATLVPPLTVDAQRADFVQGIVPIGILEQLVFTPTNFAALLEGAGSVRVTYDYTPAEVADVPEPATLALLGLGLLGLCRAGGGISRLRAGMRARA